MSQLKSEDLDVDLFTVNSQVRIGQRKSRRVKLKIDLTVTGYDQDGTPFTDHVQTENVSKDGGCVLLDRDLRRNQSLRIEANRGIRFPARVRWCVQIDGILRRVGFQLNPTAKNGWVIADHN